MSSRPARVRSGKSFGSGGTGRPLDSVKYRTVEEYRDEKRYEDDLDLTPWGNGSGGQQGYGSTNGPGPIAIYDSSGAQVWARVDNQLFFDGLDGMYITVLENTTYLLQVERDPAPTLGANDFYLVKADKLADGALAMTHGAIVFENYADDSAGECEMSW